MWMSSHILVIITTTVICDRIYLSRPEEIITLMDCLNDERDKNFE